MTMFLLYFVWIVHFATHLSAFSQQCQDVLGHPSCKLLPDDSQCGVNSDSDLTPRIVGGENAILGAHPWMACLLHKHYDVLCFCGGSLLNKLYVLTAAHCMILLKRLWVILGEYDLRTDPDCIGSTCAPPKQTIAAQQVLIHGGKMPHSDIALIRLETPAELTRFVSPICLPVAGFTDTDNLRMRTAGWGDTVFGSDFSPTPILQTLSVNAVPNDLCREQWAPIAAVYNDTICINPFKNGIYKNVYHGDSGGPLVTGSIVNQRFKYYIIGVTSIGYGNATNLKPNLFTRVSSYITWIIDHIEP